MNIEIRIEKQLLIKRLFTYYKLGFLNQSFVIITKNHVLMSNVLFKGEIEQRMHFLV